MKTISTELLRTLFTYDGATGNLIRRIPSDRLPAGSVANKVSRLHGHQRVAINRKFYYAHRLVWQIVYGEPPARTIDHVNGDPADNRISNLRLCNDSQNQANRKRPATNTSGLKGVTWNKASQKWQAGIKVHRKSYHLGLFDDPEEAHRAYMEAARQHFGEFARAA